MQNGFAFPKAYSVSTFAILMRDVSIQRLWQAAGKAASQARSSIKSLATTQSLSSSPALLSMVILYANLQSEKG